MNHSIHPRKGAGKSQNQSDPFQLGIGISLQPSHYLEILEDLPPIEWLEIISEHFMDTNEQNNRFLERILEHYPVVQHGIALSIGSAEPLDFEYLKKLKLLIRKTKAPWVSDHLSWGKWNHSHYHDLMPLPFTKKVIDYISERARIVQDYLEVPFALENVTSYAPTAHNEMPEWEFFSKIVEQANIHMLLDVNNIYISSKNNCFTVEEYCKNIPLGRIIEIHISGHTEHPNKILDTHDLPVQNSVWEVYEKIYHMADSPATLLEWAELPMTAKEVWEEALKARKYQQREVPGCCPLH